MFRKKESERPKPYSLADLHAKRSGRRRVHVWLFLLFGAVLFSGGMYLVFLSPVFRVQRFTFSEASSLPENVLLRELQASISQNSFLSSVFHDDSILLWGEQDVVRLSAELSRVASVHIDRDFLKREIILTVQERERELIWCNVSHADVAGFTECFWVDTEGRIFEEAPIPRGGLVRALRD